MSLKSQIHEPDNILGAETPTAQILHPGALRSIQEMLKGKAYAFTAVVSDEAAFALGVAVQGEPGYWPIPVQMASSPMWEAMNSAATRLNENLGLSEQEAIAIVSSTMAAQNKRGRRR